MTTHDRPLTDSYQAQPAVTETTGRVADHTASTAADERLVPTSAPPPAAVGANQGQVASEGRSSAPAEGESSTEQVLFGDNDLADLRARWAGVQATFVDDPKDCVQKADVLVSHLVDRLTKGFADARSRLEEQWARGEQASTEDLRLALMHYRDLFERLLAV